MRRIFGGFDSRRRHGGNWLTFKTHFAANFHHRHDDLDAVDFLRRAGVKLFDPRMRVGREEELSVKHARQADVLRINAVPVDLAGPSARRIGLFNRRCLSLAPHDGPALSSTSISTSPTGTPFSTFGTLIVFFAIFGPSFDLPRQPARSQKEMEVAP